MVGRGGGGRAHCTHGRLFCLFCLLQKHERFWESKIFRKFLKFIKLFWIKNLFPKVLCLGGSGPFVRTFSEIWKMVFAWSVFKFSQQKMNLLFLYWFCSKCTMTDQEYINCIGVNSSKWFLVNRCYDISNLRNLQGVVIEMTSQLHQVTQTKHKNKQTMETKERCSVSKVSLIDHF